MELNDPTATINALLCACVVITLMFYRRGDSRHRPWVSRLAWLITVTYSAVPLPISVGFIPIPHGPLSWRILFFFPCWWPSEATLHVWLII